MSITLEQYVEQALLEITNAVHKAKQKSPIPIAPGHVEGKKQLEPQIIEFSIQVGVSEEKNRKGKGEISAPIISIIKANIGGEVGSKNEHTITQSLNFSVPVYFQGQK